jgi:polar amino acid transport system permease protein
VVITSVLSVFQYYIERHFSKGALRTLPLTPLQRARKFFTTHVAATPTKESR